MHGARPDSFVEGQGIAVGAIDATLKRERAPGRELHGEPGDPFPGGAKAESPRTGGVGGDHPAHRGAGLGRVERQRQIGCARGELRLQLAQRRAGERADGGRCGAQVELHHTTQTGHRYEVSRGVRDRAPDDARAGAAHSDAVPVCRVPAQYPNATRPGSPARRPMPQPQPSSATRRGAIQPRRRGRAPTSYRPGCRCRARW